MLSRRNIRVKVMQTLYSLEAINNETRPGEAIAILKKNLEQSKQLFTYLVFFITKVAGYAEVDARQKSGKHLPTHGDLNINTKIAGNEIIRGILQDESFKKTVDEYNLTYLIDDELVKKHYQLLVNSPEYQLYTSIPSRNKKSEKKVLEFIFSEVMLPNEDFISHMEEHF